MSKQQDTDSVKDIPNDTKWYSDMSELTGKSYKSDQERLETHEAFVGDVGNMILKTSSGNNNDTLLKFVNQLDEPVSYYWFNFDGAEQKYATIQPYASQEQPTLIGHQWRVRRDSDQQIVFECEGEPKPRTFKITPDKVWRHKESKQLHSDCQRKTLYTKKPAEKKEGSQKEFLSMFSDQSYSTVAPYKYFLQNGGFSAFPDVVIVRMDWKNIKSLNAVDGTFCATIKLMMNTVETSYVKENSHEYDFKVLMKNCIADEGENVHTQRQTQGMDGFQSFETDWKKKFMLWKEVKDEELGLQKWVYDESFSVCELDNVEFSESYEVEHFPFDIQKLKILVQVKNLENKIVIPVGGEIAMQSPLPEWDIIDYSIDFEQHDQRTSSEIDGPANICYNITLKRKYNWFVFNNMVLMFLITSLVCLVYGIGVEDLADRASVTLGLLLTVVAQKFAIADMLPKVGYLTMMDRYIIYCIMLLVTVSLENFAICKISQHKEESDKEAVEKLDEIILKIIGGIWLFYNLFIVIQSSARVATMSKLGSPWPQHISRIPTKWYTEDDQEYFKKSKKDFKKIEKTL